VPAAGIRFHGGVFTRRSRGKHEVFVFWWDVSERGAHESASLTPTAAAFRLAAGISFHELWVDAADKALASTSGKYQFDTTISRQVLENYLSRSITMEGLLNGRGDLDDDIRMLKSAGAKFIGRSLCLWGGEANLLRNLERARQQVPKVHEADPEMILQACIFEIVTTQVEQVPVPDWAFAAFGLPLEKRNFRYAEMLYPSGQFKDHWRAGNSVPDVSRPETKLWFSWNSTTGASAGSRGSRTPAGSGFGATTKSPGSRTRTSSIEAAGCNTRGIGCGGRTRTAIWKCPAAGQHDRHATTFGGTTPTAQAQQFPRGLATRTPFGRSGRQTKLLSQRAGVQMNLGYAFRISSQPLRYTGRLMNGAASGAFVARKLA